MAAPNSSNSDFTANMHVSYEKMPHSSANWKFAGASNNPDRVKWCVTEKVHGANFCFHCDGQNVYHAKRTALISSDDEFFGYQSMATKLKPQILDCYRTFIGNKSMVKKYITLHNKQQNNHNAAQYELSHISVYGELFGGFYPISSNQIQSAKSPKNKRQKKSKRQKQKQSNTNADETKQNTEEIKQNDSNDNNQMDTFVVQREILYSPNIEFYAFDIAIVLKDHHNANKTRRQYINYEDAISIFEAVKIFYAKPLFIGKYEDCCHHNHEFKSQISKWLGLPPLPKEYGANLAEGIVIKPMKSLYVEGKGGKLKRAIMKHKHKTFNERISAMDQEFGKFDDHKGDGLLKGVDMIHAECLLKMINRNRYQSVISKLGDPRSKTRKHGGKQKKKQENEKRGNVESVYVQAMVEDVVQDIEHDKTSPIYQWWNAKVMKSDELRKYIENKMSEKARSLIQN